MNLPIAVWMMRSFLADIPPALFEAASLDGAGLIKTLTRVVGAHRDARHRLDVADLLHLRLERVAAGEPADQQPDRRRPLRCS